MKNIILSALVLSGITAHAQQQQVGINTAEPKATLHIEAGESESKGLIIPRISADEMKTMSNLPHFGQDQHAIITYLYGYMPPADRTGKLVNVIDQGYYFYNHWDGKWQKFGDMQDLRMVATNNHLTQDAGIDGNGTNLGYGSGNIGIGKTFSGFTTSTLMGNNNIGIGTSVYSSNGGSMFASGNTGIGYDLYRMYNGGNLTVGDNIAIGRSLYEFRKTNAQFTGGGTGGNIAIGSSSFKLQNGDFIGHGNMALGVGSFYLRNGDLTGNANIGIGQALYSMHNGNMAGSINLAMGYDIFKLENGNFEGRDNIGIGNTSYIIRNGDITNSVRNNISLGYNIYRVENNSASTFAGRGNIGIGSDLYTLSGNLTGRDNIVLGSNTMNSSTGDISGNNNIALGKYAMQAGIGITGDNNIALGNYAMASSNISGTDNIAIGTRTLNPSKVGNYNIAIGSSALNNIIGRGNANIQIGNSSIGIPVAGELNNVVAIGNEMSGFNTSDVILLGKSGSYGPKVGIGTYNPKTKLDVEGNIRASGGIQVGTSSIPCNWDNRGTIHFSNNKFQGCDGNSWVNLH